jgi:hypothetical protein
VTGKKQFSAFDRTTCLPKSGVGFSLINDFYIGNDDPHAGLGKIAKKSCAISSGGVFFLGGESVSYEYGPQMGHDIPCTNLQPCYYLTSGLVRTRTLLDRTGKKLITGPHEAGGYVVSRAGNVPGDMPPFYDPCDIGHEIMSGGGFEYYPDTTTVWEDYDPEYGFGFRWTSRSEEFDAPFGRRYISLDTTEYTVDGINWYHQNTFNYAESTLNLNGDNGPNCSEKYENYDQYGGGEWYVYEEPDNYLGVLPSDLGWGRPDFGDVFPSSTLDYQGNHDGGAESYSLRILWTPPT